MRSKHSTPVRQEGPTQRPFFTPPTQSRGEGAFFAQLKRSRRTDSRIQRDETSVPSPEGEEESPITGGLGTVAENLTDNNPAFDAWLDLELERLEHHLWTRRSTADKVGMVTSGALTYTTLILPLFTDPEYREAMEDFNFALPLWVIPGFPLRSLSYQLPHEGDDRWRFETEWSTESMTEDFRARHPYIPSVDLELDAYYRNRSDWGLSGGSLELDWMEGGINLSGSVNRPYSPFPMLLPGDQMGGGPTWLMESIPGPEIRTPEDFRIFLNVDFAKILWHRSRRNRN